MGSALAQADLFTANRIVGLVPLSRHLPAAARRQTVCRRLLRTSTLPIASRHTSVAVHDCRGSSRSSNHCCGCRVAERVCRRAYRSYLQRRAARWTSPEQVHLGDHGAQAHTRSHRSDVISRFEETLATLP